MNDKIKNFIEQLSTQYIDSEKVFNQYHEEHNFPQYFTTKMNLLLYLTQMKEMNPKTILIGEAPGKKGCALTGIPFTSPYIISEQNKFGLFGFSEKSDTTLQKENTATMVWDTLDKLDFCPLLWNAYPFNPIDPITMKNRKPTVNEIEIGENYLKEISSIFNIKNFIAVGQSADNILDKMKIKHSAVSHPSYGNKQKFYNGLRKLMIEGGV